MKRSVAIFILALLAVPTHARDIDGAVVPETRTLADSATPLVLNGAGLRTRYLVKVYIVALYTPQHMTTAEQVLDSREPRVIAITMRRDTDSEKIASAFLSSIIRNHTPAELKTLQDRNRQFELMMPELKRNDVLRLEFPPNGETRVVRNDQLLGTLAGADFQRALLKIWLGSVPVDAGLKRALLGAGK